MESFDTLYREAHPKLYCAALAWTRNAEDAEDVLSEVMIRAFEKFNTWRRESSFYTWAYTITYHAFLHRRRSHPLTKSLEALREFNGFEIGANDPSHSALERAEELEKARIILTSLPSKLRKALMASVVNRERQKQTAKRLKVSQGTIGSRTFTARREFRKRWKRIAG